MSYILDALKRAERERALERGSVPGIHTAVGSTPMPEARGRHGLSATASWGMAALCLMLVLALTAAWWALGRVPSRAAEERAAAPAAAPAVIASAMPTPIQEPLRLQPQPPSASELQSGDGIGPGAGASARLEADAVSSTVPAAGAPTAARADRAATRDEAAAHKAAEAKEAKEVKGARQAKRTGDAGVRNDAEARTAASTTAAAMGAPASPSPSIPPAPIVRAEADRVDALADLPADIRQQLPALAFSGVTYSENPLYRMVIVNGQVVQEKGTAAPGVTLERIRPREAVLSFRGHRYRVAY